MKKIHIYPGTFCPPHYGHVELAKAAAKTFGKIFVVCSNNPVKGEKTAFYPEECVKMWKTYSLGKDIKVLTFDEFMKKWNKKDILIMIRGIRNDDDIVYENDILKYNRDHYGVMHYHYIIANHNFRELSSTAVCDAAKSGDIDKLMKMVNREVAVKIVAKCRAAN